MTTVRQVLGEKGYKVFTVGPDDTVLEAISRMAAENVGALVVVDGARPIGMFTERHYARNVFLKGRASPKTPVRDVMETEVLFVQPDQTVEECMAIMTDRRVRHLPVMEKEKMIGIVSIGDLVKNIISDQTFTINQLIHFIHG